MKITLSHASCKTSIAAESRTLCSDCIGIVSCSLDEFGLNENVVKEIEHAINLNKKRRTQDSDSDSSSEHKISSPPHKKRKINRPKSYVVDYFLRINHFQLSLNPLPFVKNRNDYFCLY